MEPVVIDQTQKQLRLADDIVREARQLDDAIARLGLLIAEFPHAGQMTDAIFANTPLRHVTANDIATLVARYQTIAAWFNAENRRDILRKVR